MSSLQQDEWVVCRVFQKSASGKKYPSNHSRAIVNTYNLEIGPSSLMHPQMMPPTEPCQLPVERNYMSNAELMEMSRVFRGNRIGFNFPIQSHLNYPAAGGCFTISGLNLNLSGATSTQQIFRPAAPPPPSSVVNQQDASSSMFAATSAIAGDALYGAGVNNGNVLGNRLIHMDGYWELDNYWHPY
ncbi:hypothetical protein U1Q18_036368 [Sarracenia purpurea var. burkii]